MAPRRSIPDGWHMVERVSARTGKTKKFYTNALGQKFFTMEDLLRYADYAKKSKLSIYSPDFKAPAVGESSKSKARNGNDRGTGEDFKATAVGESSQLEARNANYRGTGEELTPVILDELGERAPKIRTLNSVIEKGPRYIPEESQVSTSLVAPEPPESSPDLSGNKIRKVTFKLKKRS